MTPIQAEAGTAREIIAGITGVLWADEVIAALKANGYEINMTYVERIKRAQSGSPMTQAEAGTAREIIAEELPRCYINSDYLKDADAIIAALHAAGYKIMAREPTEAMIGGDWTDENSGFEIYRAMWDAAP